MTTEEANTGSILSNGADEHGGDASIDDVIVQTANNRPPFYYPPDNRPANDEDSALETRYRYYNRLDPRNDSSLVMPSHIVPSYFFSIIAFEELSKQGSLVTVFSIWNTMMGTALLSMPWAFNQAGFILGLVLIIVMGLLAFYTAFLVVDNTRIAANNTLHKNIEFSDVCRYYFGVWGDRVALLFSMISLLGATTVYWVLMSNFLYFTGTCIYEAIHEPASPWSVVDTNLSMTCDAICPDHHADNGSVIANLHNSTFYQYWQLRRTVPLYLFLLVFPLLNMKSPTFFTKFNVLGTVSVFYLLSFVTVKLYKCGFHLNFGFHSSDFNVTESIKMFKSTFPHLTGTLALSYFLHNCIVTILKNQKNPKNNGRDLGSAYFLVIVTYSLIAIVFFTAFPLPKDCIADNFLNNFGVGDLMSSIARVFLLFQMLTVYPLLTYLIRVQVFYCLYSRVYPSVWHVIGLNLCINCVGILFALFFPSVGSILRFVGSVSGFVYLFTLPCLVHMKRLKAESKLGRTSLIVHCLIIVAGIANLFGQFI